MSILFYSKDIERLLAQERLVEVVELLEREYSRTCQGNILTALVVYCWDFFVEGDFRKQEGITDDEADFFSNKYREYFNLGLKEFENEPGFLYAAGYVSALHGAFVAGDEWYNSKGIELMDKCSKADSIIAEFAKIYLKNSKPRNKVVYYDGDHKNVIDCFPTNSMLDEYFKGALMG